MITTEKEQLIVFIELICFKFNIAKKIDGFWLSVNNVRLAICLKDIKIILAFAYAWFGNFVVSELAKNKSQIKLTKIKSKKEQIFKNANLSCDFEISFCFNLFKKTSWDLWLKKIFKKKCWCIFFFYISLFFFILRHAENSYR